LTLAILLVASRASADEVHVMVSGAFTAAYKLLVADWERSTGHSVITVYGASMGATPTAIPNRLAIGEQADIVILARAALDALAKNGTVIAGSQTDLARSRIAMAVRAAARVPDISTTARFRQVLLQARSIAYSDSASGVYISTEMFRKLGIAGRVSGKAKKIEGTPVGEVVAKGDAEIGFQQLSELVPVHGITIVGPIPASVQRVTTFSGGIPTASQARAVARQLLSYLSSLQASKTIRSSGLDPIATTVTTKTGTR
jgi:molybdate transport system substrate-binding protein